MLHRLAAVCLVLAFAMGVELAPASARADSSLGVATRCGVASGSGLSVVRYRRGTPDDPLSCASARRLIDRAARSGRSLVRFEGTDWLCERSARRVACSSGNRVGYSVVGRRRSARAAFTWTTAQARRALRNVPRQELSPNADVSRMTSSCSRLAGSRSRFRCRFRLPLEETVITGRGTLRLGVRTSVETNAARYDLRVTFTFSADSSPSGPGTRQARWRGLAPIST